MIVGFEDYKNNYNFNVKGIVHVGAHIGQEYDEYIQNFGNIETHWFEPIPSIYNDLENNLKGKPGVNLYNFALGETESKSQMFVDIGNEGQSSSILKPKEHINQFPHIVFDDTNKTDITISKLDNFDIGDSNMLVLDTQGYELNVLKGSLETLNKIDYIFTEFNTVEMYDGCPKIEDIDLLLSDYGFERVETWYTSQNWGDAFYIKTKSPKDNIKNMKIVYVTPHLSTGGMPEYLRKKVELLKDEHDVWVIELKTEWAYRIIRDKIESLIGNRLIAVNNNFEEMFDIIQQIQPDILHFEELSDYHIPSSILDKIYVPERKYKIFETFHDSSIESYEKSFLPDKMLVVSPWQLLQMKELGVPIEVVNHEIETSERNRDGLSKLGLDLNKKHVMQVGLFSRRKNQSETFELARLMPDVNFHFLGGLTENYSDYWKPLMENKPDNCIIWNERSDVYSFYECFDAVIFPSRGQYGDRETNPLVIRESIAWKIPLLVRDLPVYMGMYKQSDKVKFMSDDINKNVKILQELLNKNKIIEMVEMDTKPEWTPLSGSIFKKKLFNITFNSVDNKINFEYLESVPMELKVCIRDIDTEVPIYSFKMDVNQGSSYWCIPIPKNHYDFHGNPNFGGFLFDFYDKGDNRVYFMTQRIKRSAFQKPKCRIESYDPLFVNYEQFFTDEIYKNLFGQIESLDFVVDIGANVGLFTKLCLNKGANKVIAVEINSDAIKTFKKLHNSPNVKLIDKAIAESDGQIEIFINPDNSIISSINKENAGSNTSQIIDAISFNTLVEQNSIDRIDLLKVDVEGAEYDIFRSINEKNLSKIKYILMEFHNNYGGRLRDDILNKLESAGFEYDLYLDDCIGMSNDYEESGVIFAKNKN